MYWCLSGCRSSVAEHCLHKPGVLGSIPGDFQPFHSILHLITSKLSLFQHEARVLSILLYILLYHGTSIHGGGGGGWGTFFPKFACTATNKHMLNYTSAQYSDMHCSKILQNLLMQRFDNTVITFIRQEKNRNDTR